MSSASWLAWCFHNIYEELAPKYGYKTRHETAVPFSGLPDENRELMIATCEKLLDEGVIAITYKDPHMTWPVARAGGASKMTDGHGPESGHPWWCVLCNREAGPIPAGDCPSPIDSGDQADTDPNRA